MIAGDNSKDRQGVKNTPSHLSHSPLIEGCSACARLEFSHFAARESGQRLIYQGPSRRIGFSASVDGVWTVRLDARGQ
jgi:hypothetical protein